MFVVSVVGKSEPVQPYWIGRQGGGVFIGIGEAKSLDAANRAAIADLMTKISQEIGVDFSAESELMKREVDGVISEKSGFQIDSFSGAFLRDIVSRIGGSYWEQCRAQTGRKNFEDFYRYYVTASVSPAFIDSLRRHTNSVNDRLLSEVERRLAAAEEQLSGEEFARPVEALNELLGALQEASELYYRRGPVFEEIGERMLALIASMRITVAEAYSEVRPERHYYKFQVVTGRQPASGVKLRFALTRGLGSVKELAFSDAEGAAVCDVYKMDSQAGDNQLTTRLDIGDIADRVGTIRHPGASGLKDHLLRAADALTRRDHFSTVSKRAFVTGGSLVVVNVRKYHYWFFRRVRDLEFNLHLTEHNGRDVEFEKYSVFVQVWFEDHSLFSGKRLTDTRTGEFSFYAPFRLPHSSMRSISIPGEAKTAGLINELKAAHEFGMSAISIRMTLYGKDDAGNAIQVELPGEETPWDRFFEK